MSISKGRVLQRTKARDRGAVNRARSSQPGGSRARERVVVTGMGLISPLGTTVEELWQGLLTGISAVKPVTRFDPSGFSCRLAAEVASFELPELPRPYLHEASQMDRFIQYALAAAASAFAASRFPLESLGSTPGGIYLGVAMGGLGTLEDSILQQEAEGPRTTNPYLISAAIPNMAAGLLALVYGFEGPQYTMVGGCASGIQAIGQAMESIRSGGASWALAGGSEAVITPITFAGFEAMGILTHAPEPKPTPRPFDRERDGMIVGEGAGMLILENRDDARARGAPILAELTGYATSSVTSQAFFQCSEATARCMERALDDGGIGSAELDCVYSHAGGLAGDVKDLKAIRTVCGDEGRPAVTSTKGHIGYSFAAAGPLDAITAIQALAEQQISPTLNFTAPEPEFAGIDIVDQPRRQRLRNGLVNSFGLGGVNACLLVTEAGHRS
jgi:3-oxoacyl-[acyl-carrier-protein] synthase II